MMEVTEYDPQSGAITRVYSFPNAEYREANARPNQIEGGYRAENYFVINGEPVERPEQSTMLTGLWLTHLPIPSTLHIDGTAYPVDQSIMELDFTMPGTYHLRVEAFPFLDWTAEVTV